MKNFLTITAIILVLLVVLNIWALFPFNGIEPFFLNGMLATTFEYINNYLDDSANFIK